MQKVSVIIPVYKAEDYIASTVQSVLDQSYKNFELIIVDDGSPDRSVEICQQFSDPRIAIVRQENRGVAAARNTGIRQATGEYIALLDADDLWLPDKLAKHVEHLNTSPEVGVSFSRSAFIDQEGNPLGIYQMSKLKDVTPLDLLCRTPIGNGSVAVIRKEVFEAIRFQDNLYGTPEDFYFDDDRQLHPSEDVECWLRMAIQTDWQIEGLAEALTLYRVNPQGCSAQLVKKLHSWETLIEKVRSYAAEQMAQWEKPAMAYQLRHLARRAVTLGDGATAVKFSHRALSTYSAIALEELPRTFLTVSASYLLWLLPKSLYHTLQNLAIDLVGSIQKRRILQERA
ncbi:glycosyltransferase family 2 protein [Desertifilum sp. FACHB-1129]|uniref:Glucosyl transferase n=2 Tax=Desertifilum tharense IPPAS B-1220 TaxID=1781255 RepID=A0A1E5QGW3_9CYAN|nr:MULTISPECIES: glycosyltransferase family 2 protein [Desertifilum]MDA0209553.1 glycosyltransferase family 2 protein [Cyanobacteria bacterium FC1]MBD2312963.1 glycosyltransferase family 2 protein [Desertifilum sp. FACHB-1129]MBD2320991.1 glycosyltransferase family 2 protein [Desertifilum sp. FACHB-866]MBD2331120.1 glycosyltransferase family 2 protein [Desertifilum sp. FACHB-868]OEJ73930.1 glucosyl transferase [Desertifilum tharense IPPAS B-1220]